ncbi:hypothetical protein GYB59_00675 [bacterium]|nr:hypothetical protein [bacterium]
MTHQTDHEDCYDEHGRPLFDFAEIEEAICRGSLALGTSCGHCQKCKAAAFDWLVENSPALDEWAVIITGQHDVMKAVKQVAREDGQ